MNFLIILKQKTRELFVKENIYYLLLIIIIFLLDRFSKIKIISNFSDVTYYVNDYINLDLIWNIGIGFGLLSSDSVIIYNSISFIICLVILFLFYIALVSDNYDKFIYSIIIGGALGNFYDRITFSAVPDFIDLHFKNFHWFTFNVADVFISMGIVFFLLKNILFKKK